MFIISPLHTGRADVNGGGPGEEKVRTVPQNDQQSSLNEFY